MGASVMKTNSRSILIIDDDAAVRSLLHRSLARAGYEIQEAEDGHSGLRVLLQHSVDLIITDIIMPGMEGIEFIQSLQRTHPKTPIIAISGGGRLNPDGYLRMAESFGAARVLKKPFELGVLHSTVVSLIGPGQAPTAQA